MLPNASGQRQPFVSAWLLKRAVVSVSPWLKMMQLLWYDRDL
jgi:hypothetical protein